MQTFKDRSRLPTADRRLHFANSFRDYIFNARMVRNAMEYASVLPNYFRSMHQAGAHREAFTGVHTYVTFIGIGRSGTTLIGSLLDAHPRIIMANQETSLKYMHPRLFSRFQVYWLLCQNSRQRADNRTGGGGYSYAVKDQWQGRFEKLAVIGDKSKSAQDVTWLTSSPRLLDRMAALTGARIRMMHVIRNPFDTIATRSVRRKLSLEKISREYFALCDKLVRLIQRLDSISEYDVARIPVYLEDFIEDPVQHLAIVCKNLGVEAGYDYLRDCAKIVKRSPHKSRYEVKWDPALIEAIQEKLRRFPFLARYSFSS
jgi:hypothetical protein